ncbi:AsmA family protein [Psychromonas sp. psych-6C06]|uniref:AsmA family protein n=1 Tax=Psychromonas sp. psych-6C06 TaxID=2058089 RepID=UPI000C342387|nr:AsmA family protein [Psychromonas sp. psych-6C06]PKF63459.1 AsmA family protein [Psychromonas sp. psych-6C06]
MKLFIKLAITLVVLLLLAVLVLLVLVNPNDYKPEIEAQVKQSINRDLHIKGDIGWTFFPQLGFSAGEIELDNLSGFSKPHLAKVKDASLGINILPLLKGEISIGKLTLDGFELTLLTTKEGVSNLDNMSSATENTTDDNNTSTSENDSPEDTTQGESFFDISKTQLAGIDINNTVIEIQDLQADSYQKFTVNEIKLGQFSFDQATDLSVITALVIDDMKVNLQLTSKLLVNNSLDNIQLNNLLLKTDVTADALPNGALNSLLKTDINYAVNSKKVTLAGVDIKTDISGDNLPNKKVVTQFNADVTYLIDSQKASIDNLKLLIDKLSLAGDVTVQTGLLTKVRYQLVANEWDLNPYMAQKEKQATSSDAANSPSGTDSSSTSSNTSEEVEPDLSFLKGLDIDGTLKIAGVKVEKIKIGEINKHLIIKKGKAQLKPLTAALYGGMLTVNGEVDESNGKNKYQIATQLKNVSLRPLLTDAAELDMLSGTTAFDFTGKGQGLTATKIQEEIIGQGNFKLLDGELYGVNIPQEIRVLKAKIKGKALPTSDSIKKTDFASLTGNFSIASGLVNNQKLLMLSPVMRLDGNGLAHIIEQSLDYKLSITPLSKSTEKTDYADLTGITLPLLIKGSFTNPSFSIDTDGALKDYAKQQLAEKQEKLKQQAEKALSEQTKNLDAETQEKIKKESKRLEDKLKKFF